MDNGAAATATTGTRAKRATNRRADPTGAASDTGAAGAAPDTATAVTSSDTGAAGAGAGTATATAAATAGATAAAVDCAGSGLQEQSVGYKGDGGCQGEQECSILLAEALS